MIARSIKTMLFASLIAAMILPFSAGNMTFAEKETTTQEEEKLAKYQKELAEMKQKTLRENKIYDSKLVDRYGETWEDQFLNKETFDDMMFSLKTYATADLPESGWNDAMVAEHIKIHNFDTIIEKTGFGHEIVSLVVAKQKLQKQYNQTGPVEKFHEWLDEKHPAPDSVEKIDKRLSEIISAPGFVGFATALTESFNTLAQHGNVPDELFDRDSAYWNVIANIAMCKYSPGCDEESLQGILDSKAYERDASEPPEVASGWLALILPNAFAWSETYHYSTIYGEPFTCTYSTCKVTIDIPWSVGEHEANAFPPDTTEHEGQGHGTSQYMEVYVSTCSNQNAYNYVVAKLTIISEIYSSTISGWGCTKIETTVQVSDRTSPWYVWNLEGTTNSWMP